jgi:hypothetical protein
MSSKVELGAGIVTGFREARTKDQKLELRIEIINVLPLRLRAGEAAHIFMKGDIFRDEVL